MSLGIIAFALVGVLGLISPGLSSFRKAIGTSVGTQIAQQVMSDLRQSDFNTLTQSHPIRYFDEQGQENSTPNPTQNPSIFHVNTIVQNPVTLPSSTSSNLAQVTVEIIYNPSNKSLVRDSTGHVQESLNKGVRVYRYSGFIARTQ